MPHWIGCLQYLTSFFRRPALIAIAFTMTSTGMLAPIFRDAGELDMNSSRLFLAAATIGVHPVTQR